MILALLLAAQPVQFEGYTPQEERAVEAMMECFLGQVNVVPRRERRRRGEALIAEALGACSAEEAALRTLLRSRYDEQSTVRVIEVVRAVSGDGLRRFLAR